MNLRSRGGITAQVCRLGLLLVVAGLGLCACSAKAQPTPQKDPMDWYSDDFHKVVAKAYYVPFSWMFGGARSAKQGGLPELPNALVLTLTSFDTIRILNQARGNHNLDDANAKINPEQLRLVVKALDGKTLLRVDGGGNAEQNGEQFALLPNGFLLLSIELDYFMKRQIASESDVVDDKQTALQIAKAYYAKRLKKPIPAKTVFQTRSEGGVWRVRCDSGKRRTEVTIARSDGALLDIFDDDYPATKKH